MNIWLVDPKTDQKSVSLTMLVLSIVTLVVGTGLHMAEVVKSTSLLFEFFGSSAALYFGRRLNFSGKQFSSDNPEEKKEDK